MIIPIRCFSCGKPIAQDWENYDKGLADGKKPQDVLDSLGLSRYCCRRMFVAHTEIVEDIMQYDRLQ